MLKTLMLPDDAFDENCEPVPPGRRQFTVCLVLTDQPTASNNHRLALEAESGEHGAINIDFELWVSKLPAHWHTRRHLGWCRILQVKRR